MKARGCNDAAGRTCDRRHRAKRRAGAPWPSRPTGAGPDQRMAGRRRRARANQHRGVARTVRVTVAVGGRELRRRTRRERAARVAGARCASSETNLGKLAFGAGEQQTLQRRAAAEALGQPRPSPVAPAVSVSPLHWRPEGRLSPVAAVAATPEAASATSTVGGIPGASGRTGQALCAPGEILPVEESQAAHRRAAVARSVQLRAQSELSRGRAGPRLPAQQRHPGGRHAPHISSLRRHRAQSVRIAERGRADDPAERHRRRRNERAMLLSRCRRARARTTRRVRHAVPRCAPVTMASTWAVDAVKDPMLV